MKDMYAAFIFFTRLPLWRLKAYPLSSGDFSRVIGYWAVTGLLTGGVAAGALYLLSYMFPYTVAVVFALVCRTLVTGALHEDGLADFFDGFGGGVSRERILEVMKDSHIGTYGVIGLVFYFLMFVTLLSGMDVRLACAVLFAGDPLSKLISSQITVVLPYARSVATSKTKTVYEKPSWQSIAVSMSAGLLPLLLLEMKWWLATLFPLCVFVMLILMLKKRIGGYTGDCCGAMFLLCELSFYVGISLLCNCQLLNYSIIQLFN